MIFRSVTQWAAVGTLAGAITEPVQAPGQKRMNVANGQTEWGLGALRGSPDPRASYSQPQLPVQRTRQSAPTAIWTRERHLHGFIEMRGIDGRTAVANDLIWRSPSLRCSHAVLYCTACRALFCKRGSCDWSSFLATARVKTPTPRGHACSIGERPDLAGSR